MATNQEAIDRSVREQVGEAVSGLRQEIRHSVREAVKETKPEPEPAPKADPDAGKFKVTAPGYSEQFTSKRAALASFEGLKKRLIKKEQVATLRLLVQETGSTKWATVQELKLNEDAFE